jgi:hypothetical protein
MYVSAGAQTMRPCRCCIGLIAALALAWCHDAFAAENRVILLRGYLGLFSNGLDELADELKAKGFDVEVRPAAAASAPGLSPAAGPLRSRAGPPPRRSRQRAPQKRQRPALRVADEGKRADLARRAIPQDVVDDVRPVEMPASEREQMGSLGTAAVCPSGR